MKLTYCRRQNRNRGRIQAVLKAELQKSKIIMTLTLVMFTKLHGKGGQGSEPEKNLRNGIPDLLSSSWVQLRLKKKSQNQNHNLKDLAYVTCILSRESPGFQKSRNVYGEIRQNTAGDASWNLLCFIHALLAAGWFPGGGWISQGSDVRGNK